MLDIEEDVVSGLPVDRLGLLILDDLIATQEWNEYNYQLAAQRHFGLGQAVEAIAEAFGWLRARALIARTPGQSSETAIFVTRTGRQVAKDGATAFHASERLQGGTHPRIEREARPQFLIGEYELGVFASMKSVEVRVRSLGGFSDEDIGVDLMNRAFGPSGPLTDPTASKGEKDGTRCLFVGAYAVFRNPSGHREVDFEDVSEAAEMVQTASLLMRILDRIEVRMAG